MLDIDPGPLADRRDRGARHRRPARLGPQRPGRRRPGPDPPQSTESSPTTTRAAARHHVVTDVDTVPPTT